MAPPIPIVIDTDIGADPDDAMALAFAAASPEVELLGVTVVDGDVELRARMASRILGMAGRADIPVVPGERLPVGDGRGPTMLGFEGRGLLDLPYGGPEAPIERTPATTWLSEQARRRPFHLVAIGPLTTVARALAADPALAGRLGGLTVMGGVLDPSTLPHRARQDIERRGVRAAWPDHNTASDPEAALTCARAGIPTTWVTSEITFRVPLHRATLEALPRDRWLTWVLTGMTAQWRSWWQRAVGDDDPAAQTTAVFLHDPLTVASLFGDGRWISLRPQPLRYAIEEGVFRLSPAPADAAVPMVRVTTRVDAPAFEAFFLDRLRHAPRAASRQPARRSRDSPEGA